MRIIAWFVLGFLILGSGCVQKPTAEQIRNADYGPRPKNMDAITEKWIGEMFLRDPDSARWKHGKMTSGWLVTAGHDEPTFGWIQCGLVNAKNAFGGYVGDATYVIQVNMVDGLYMPEFLWVDRAGDEGWNIAEDICSDVFARK